MHAVIYIHKVGDCDWKLCWQWSTINNKQMQTLMYRVPTLKCQN